MRSGAVVVILMLAACAGNPTYRPTNDPSFVPLEDLSARAVELDGRTIRTYGLVFMNESSRNVVSQKRIDGQICIGLLVTAHDLARLKVDDGQWRIVEGRFDKEGCGGNTICHDSCGPYAIKDPVLSPAPNLN